MEALDGIRKGLKAIVDAANLAEKSRLKCLYAAERVSSLVAQGWFLPFAVVALATAAKLESYAQTMLISHLRLFDVVGKSFLRRCRTLLQRERQRTQLAVKAVEVINEANSRICEGARERYLVHLTSTASFAAGEDEDVGAPVALTNANTTPKTKPALASSTSTNEKKRAASTSSSEAQHSVKKPKKS